VKVRQNLLVMTQIESLAESVGGVLFIVLINAIFFPEDPGFLSVEPHPFLFLTIFIAARYGTFDGFVSGLLCAMVYTAYLLGNTDIKTLFTTLEWHRLVPAYLFVIVGLILGEIREMGNREVSSLRREAQRLRLQVEQLKSELAVHRRAKEELQKMILSTGDPLSALHLSTSKLQSLDEKQAYETIVDLVENFCGAESIGVYVREEAGTSATSQIRVFSIRAKRGAEDVPSTLDSTHPAVAMVLRKKEVVTMSEAQDTSMIYCAPIINQSDQTVFGLIAVFKIPFIRLTNLTRTQLRTIARWASLTLSQALGFKDVSARVIDDPLTGLRNWKFIEERLHEEIERVSRYGGSVSLLLVRIMEIETLSPEDRVDILKGVGKILKNTLRKTDCAGTHHSPYVFAAILASTKDDKIVYPASRISEAFYREFGGIGSRFAHIYLKMGVATYSNPEPSSKGAPAPTRDDLIKQAEAFTFQAEVRK